MIEQSEFSVVVREDIWAILSRKYNTVRRGGHPSDIDEHRRERPFWPAMRFHNVEMADAGGAPEIRITFTASTEPDTTYGFKVNVAKAAEAWSKRVGIRDPQKNPSMFVAELIWYMVAFIGATEIEECPAGEDGVRWINTGADVFEPLPDADAHHH